MVQNKQFYYCIRFVLGYLRHLDFDCISSSEREYLLDAIASLQFIVTDLPF